ncbi:hypothetical protein GW17_00044982 [Ensete ventricosum]|nr:hypothetical protein GW17_00044982 [Ensete ventricosum]
MKSENSPDISLEISREPMSHSPSDLHHQSRTFFPSASQLLHGFSKSETPKVESNVQRDNLCNMFDSTDDQSAFWAWLEQESGFYFNMKYFEDEVHNGNWDNVELYLSGFTKVDDNRYSMKIFFEIRKQKYLEALDK